MKTFEILDYGFEKLPTENIDGKRYLDLHPKGYKPLDKYLIGILQWRPSNPIRKINYF